MGFVVGEWQDEAVRAAIEEHNAKVQARWLLVVVIRRGPTGATWWKLRWTICDRRRNGRKRMQDLELAKECEAEIRKRLRLLAKRKGKEAEWQRTFAEVADTFPTERVTIG